MAEASTLARPYAQAIFELANENSQLSQWSQTMQALAMIAADDQMRALVIDPNIPRADVLDIFFTLATDSLTEQGNNLLKLLSENGRLSLLPKIASQYEVLRAEAENVIEAELISAFEVSDEQKATVEKGLQKRLGRTVHLSCCIDPTLIGGAVVRAGDLVIDGSVQARLDSLTHTLGA